MNEQHTRHLFQKYPQTYRHKADGDQKVSAEHCSLMCYGFCCDDGWFELMDEFSAAFEDLIKDIPDDNPDKPYVFQVKSKFGSLRIYVEHFTLATNKLTEAAERKAATTCEKCGMKGKICTGKCSDQDQR